MRDEQRSEPIGKRVEWIVGEEFVFRPKAACSFLINAMHSKISMNKLVFFGYGSQNRCTKLMLWQSHIVQCNAHSNRAGKISRLTNHHKLFIERNCVIF